MSDYRCRKRKSDVKFETVDLLSTHKIKKKRKKEIVFF